VTVVTDARQRAQPARRPGTTGPGSAAVTATVRDDFAGPGNVRVLQSRALIVTIYGLYAREVGGWLPVSGLIALLADLGVDEAAVRSAVSRLKRHGLLVAATVDGTAGYAISPTGRAILDEGDTRIFERVRASISDGWLLAIFSVPESERHRRHTLRSQLAWLGFGSVSPGVWIAPAHLHDETREVLEREALTPYVDLFRADHAAFGDLRSAVQSWWDLAALQRTYDEFLSAYSPIRARWKRRRTTDPRAAFGDYATALTAWRRLPFLDPGLPSELLPANWHGTRAAALFGDLKSRLEAPAHVHLARVLGPGG
jgi:phenylacetic acid degradation operon negative regulatory protein